MAAIPHCWGRIGRKEGGKKKGGGDEENGINSYVLRFADPCRPGLILEMAFNNSKTNEIDYAAGSNRLPHN